jgi:hypothetical protein
MTFKEYCKWREDTNAPMIGNDNCIEEYAKMKADEAD